MTRDEALKAMKDKTPVIYTGKGSMGRATVQLAGNKVTRFRGSPVSIGIIHRVMRSKAVVRKNIASGMIYHIKDLYIATLEEMRGVRAINRRWYPNLKFFY